MYMYYSASVHGFRSLFDLKLIYVYGILPYTTVAMGGVIRLNNSVSTLAAKLLVENSCKTTLHPPV